MFAVPVFRADANAYPSIARCVSGRIRVFRIMASRYHPDNAETGDNEKFLLLTKGYAVLSDPARRAAYDDVQRARHTQPLPVFGLKEFAEGLEGEVNRSAILETRPSRASL
jgi:DnaJ-class molecular chaperone